MRVSSSTRSDAGSSGGVSRLTRWVIDPEFSFGAPSIRGIKTNAIAELVEAGEPPESVADDFSLQLAEVKAAVSHEWRYAAQVQSCNGPVLFRC